MDKFGENESERFGKRTAGKLAGAAEVAGQKLDAVVDYVESTKQSAKQTLDQVRQERWQGTKASILRCGKFADEHACGEDPHGRRHH